MTSISRITLFVPIERSQHVLRSITSINSDYIDIPTAKFHQSSYEDEAPKRSCVPTRSISLLAI